jgi:signal transduction histidine kinase
MKDKQVGDQIEDYESMIERSIERIKGMRGLIMDLLDLTKLESGKKNREVKNTDVIQIARMAMDTIEPMAIQQNVKVFLNSPETLFFPADDGELEIIFNNLISNAVKYNKEGGEVNISVRPKGQDIIIKVEDTGIGMSPEELSSLFQEFVRIKNSKTRNITGSGLGLSIIKKIVEVNYKGEITAESTAGKGSTFSVRLKAVSTEV